MSTAVQTIRLYPSSAGSPAEWTEWGSGADYWQELAQTTVNESEGTPLTDTTTPKQGLHTATKGKALVFSTEDAKTVLAGAGTVVKVLSGTMHYYGRVSVAKAYKVVFSVGGGTTYTSDQEHTSNAWTSVSITSETDLGTLGTGSPQIEIECLKADECNIFVFYFEVEVEYEPFAPRKMTTGARQAVIRAATR